MMNVLPWLKETGSALMGETGCVLCHETPAPEGLCAGCLNDLDALAVRADAVCPRCGSRSLYGVVCGRCQKKPPHTAAVFASYLYEPPVSTLLYACKHRHQAALAPVLAELMRRRPPSWLAEYPFDGIVAMPLSRERLLQRGFNQSELMVRALFPDKAGVWHVHGIRRAHRPAQSTLSREQRLTNLRGCFSVEIDVKNRNLLLIDDVVTTGASVDELARSLKKSGAAEVRAWTLAKPE